MICTLSLTTPPHQGGNNQMLSMLLMATTRVTCTCEVIRLQGACSVVASDAR